MREGQASHASQSSQRANALVPQYGSSATAMFGNAKPSIIPSGNLIPIGSGAWQFIPAENYSGLFFQPQLPPMPIPCNNIHQAIENGLQLIQSNLVMYDQLVKLCVKPSFDPASMWNNVKNDSRPDAAWLKWFLDCINWVLINNGHCSYQVAQQSAPLQTRPGW